MEAPLPAHFVGSRWHVARVHGGTVCGKPIPKSAKQRTIESVPKSRWCKTCVGAIAIIVALSDAHQELAKNRKVLTPGHGFNSERSQRAENGGRP